MVCNLISRNRKEKLQIYYGFGESPFGGCFIAWVDNKICFLGFGEAHLRDAVLSDIKGHWINSNFLEANEKALHFVDEAFRRKNLDLIISGTDFQIRVWKELLNIPFGKTISYEELAQRLESKNYTRACASAIARNNISYLIPCHRVIAKSQKTNKYRWGSEYKRQILEYEKKRNF